MRADTEHGEPMGVQQTRAPAATKGKPIEPMMLLKRLVAFMGAIPWVTLGAVGTGCGEIARMTRSSCWFQARFLS